jgi:hypothetical protein
LRGVAGLAPDLDASHFMPAGLDFLGDPRRLGTGFDYIQVILIIAQPQLLACPDQFHFRRRDPDTSVAVVGHPLAVILLVLEQLRKVAPESLLRTQDSRRYAGGTGFRGRLPVPLLQECAHALELLTGQEYVALLSRRVDQVDRRALLGFEGLPLRFSEFNVRHRTALDLPADERPW